jgi:hypothetical protein
LEPEAGLIAGIFIAIENTVEVTPFAKSILSYILCSYPDLKLLYTRIAAERREEKKQTTPERYHLSGRSARLAFRIYNPRFTAPFAEHLKANIDDDESWFSGMVGLLTIND